VTQNELPCAVREKYFEDYSEDWPQIDPQAMTRQKLSSGNAIVAQDEHSVMRRISTWQEFT
jgi:hypothetical protein